jgi:hypothetical protein
MQFSKIRDDGTEVTLVWTTEERSGATRIVHSLTSKDRPHPEFTKAMRAFVPMIAKLLEVPKQWAETLNVQSLAINTEEKSGRRGLVVTALRPVADANAPFVVHTPHLREPAVDEDGSGCWPSNTDKLIAAAEEHARAYVKGKRMQASLDLEETGEKKNGK